MRGKFCLRLVHKQWYKLPLEILQQLNWWLIKPFISKKFYLKSKNKPSFLYFLACRVNCFTKNEFNSWFTIGENNWEKLSKKIPFLLSTYVHQIRHKKNKKIKKESLKILQNKANLYEITPKKWKPNYLVLTTDFQDSCIKLKENLWIISALKSSGIISKPLKGSASRNIYKFNLIKDTLYVEKLFFQNSEKYKIQSRSNNDVACLEKIYNFSIKKNNEIILSPYINESMAMPKSCYTPVIRVVTKKKDNEDIKVLSSWIEVPSYGKIFYLNKLVNITFSKQEDLSKEQKASLSKWINYLKDFEHDTFQPCFEASIYMHKVIENIDQVAWDWIPSKVNPILLEGNSFFSLFEPQYFLHKQSLV